MFSHWIDVFYRPKTLYSHTKNINHHIQACIITIYGMVSPLWSGNGCFMEYIVVLCQICWIALLQSTDLARKGTFLLFQQIRGTCPVLTLKDERSSSASRKSWMEVPICVRTRSMTWTTPFVAIWFPWMTLAQFTVTTCSRSKNKKSDTALIAKTSGLFPHPHALASMV